MRLTIYRLPERLTAALALDSMFEFRASDLALPVHFRTLKRGWDADLPLSHFDTHSICNDEPRLRGFRRG